MRQAAYWGIWHFLSFLSWSGKNVPANQGGNITIPCENRKKIRRKRVEYRVNKQGNGAFVFGTMSVLRHQCHLDKDDTKNSVCRNMYPVLFLYNFINHLTG